MSDDALHYLNGQEALALFRSRKLSPVELMQALIVRAEEVEPTINAFCDRYFDEALDQARAAEERYMGDGTDIRPLEGLPCCVKDECSIAGRRTTSGSLIFKDRIDQTTDPMIERLEQAGAIFHARTTTPEFCLSGVTHSRIWGVTRNPHNPEFTVGGSSGGTGASLAAGTSTLGTGTDIGGSIRIPAGCCGIVGYKPPYGRVPEQAVFNLDYYSHCGPMTRSVADCALMLNTISGHHPKDIASLRQRVTIPDRLEGIEGFRVAYSIDLDYFEIDPEVRQNTLAAIDALRGLGCTVEEVELGWTQECETAAVSYLNLLWGQHVIRLMAEHRDIMTDYTVKFGEAAARTNAEDFLRAQEVAYDMYASFGPLMERFDVFVCPTNAVPAVAADHDPYDPDFRINGVRRDGENGWILTYPVNMLSRCPVMSVPSGKASNGVPTGLQIVGRTYDDLSVFRAAAALENVMAVERPAM
ncbi:MAG: amidase [Hyphomicrobiales bacterium]